MGKWANGQMGKWAVCVRTLTQDREAADLTAASSEFAAPAIHARGHRSIQL